MNEPPAPTLAEQIEAVEWAWAQVSEHARIFRGQRKLRSGSRTKRERQLDAAAATLLMLEEGGRR
jgi:hypothetical protein